jgi:hypothetical protein
MKAVELSGMHIDSLLDITWVVTNKDGNPRANAKPQQWFVVPRTIMHKEDGSVRITGGWFKKVPRTVVRRDVHDVPYKTWSEYGSGRRNEHPDSVPYHAEIRVVPLP